MSTPVEAIEPTSVTEPNREPRRPWTSSATTVGLPVLSVIAFLALWQVAAASGTWSETFVPLSAPIAAFASDLPVLLIHDFDKGRPSANTSSSRPTLRPFARVSTANLKGCPRS